MRRKTTIATVVVASLLVFVYALPNYALEPPHDISNGIGCGSCHAMHGTFLLPKGQELEVMCKSCHNPTGLAPEMADVANHIVGGGTKTVDCGACHDAHGPQISADAHAGGISAPNLSLIRADTNKYVSTALEPTLFQVKPDHYAFGEEQAPWNGVCQSCHTETSHHRNDSTADHHHQMATVQDIGCTVCHPHSGGFLATGGCTGCHAAPIGDRRQIAGPGGDFELAVHHVTTPVEDEDCTVCHYTGGHQGGVVKLKDADQGAALVYDFDPANPNSISPFCASCHDSDGAAKVGGPPFSDLQTPPDVAGSPGSEWAASAHATKPYPLNNNQPVGCFGDGVTSGCHGNAHGSPNFKMLAAGDAGTVSSTCFKCHTEGGVANMAISGPELADDIEEAFGLAKKHDLGSSVTIDGQAYTLECSTCHNPHLVSGKHAETGQGVSPITRPSFGDPVNNPRAMGKQLWGAIQGEKMDDYASTGTYRTPDGDELLGDQIPDYVTFCLDCHGPMSEPAGGISWTGDNHGLKSANVPNGGGAVPDWYGSGKGKGWNGDDCVSDDATCWPVISRGKGEQIFSRDPYDQAERIAGANFVLSCTDCHEAHGGTVSSMIRAELNGWPGSGTHIWNTSCNSCHYYYSDWHAGMSCGTASCHVSNSIHGMGAASGSTATRIFDPDLVAHFKFDGNLNDSGTWRNHGRWFDQAGSFTSGRFGKSILLDGDQPVEMGTRNEHWSTHEGYHGTWKFSEMKYNTTMEAWVYPTDANQSENLIFAKHTYTNGGYAMLLRKVGADLRAALMVNVNGGGGDAGWNGEDCNGLRGAFSSVKIPLNQWSHVAATFDTALPDADPADLSVGRIRIYVNGEDVTTSDPALSSCYSQPVAGEDDIFPYSEHSPDNEAVCYANHWCASALAFGGVMWGSGSRKGIIGRLDEIKLWNITRDAEYFETADSQTAPRIEHAEGTLGSDEVTILFNEDTYGPGGGALSDAAIVFTDLDDGRTVLSVDHSAGAKTATITLSAPLDANNDLGVDTVAATPGQVVDEYDNPAGAEEIALAMSSACPEGATGFQFSEQAGSSFVLDDEGMLYGVVSDPAETLPGDGLFHGDGVDNRIEFHTNPDCLTSADSMTLEARFKPSVVDDGDGSTVQRVFARDIPSNYQMSVWRSTGSAWTPTFQPPAGVASIAFWLKPVDPNGGTSWKVSLTDYDLCPIVADHWYRVRLVWNSAKVGGIPADYFIDDQGAAGDDVGENWAGFINCTDADQSQFPDDKKLFEGDEMLTGSGSFAVGVNVKNLGALHFNGLIDWITWSDVPDYTGLDDDPIPPQ